ncbi:MAG: histidinol-phosphate transaminase [Myxococcales bacterium]|nr:histidinol-phosphate transaminase [Myxococcales bacterium]
MHAKPKPRHFERDNVKAMEGYVPGTQPGDLAMLKLNTNENPYPPNPAVLAALGGVEGELLRRYPDPSALPFRQLAAEVHGLTPEQVIAVNGSDELLRLAIATFVPPGEPIGLIDPSYSLYSTLAAAHGSPVVGAEPDADFAPPADLAERMNRAGVRLLFLVNPHAPSGQLTLLDRVEALARDFEGVLLLDEAYVDFVDPALGYDALPLCRQLDNLLVLRTFSKGYSLAGLRFGYGMGAPSLIEPMLWKTRDSYNVDAISQRLAAVALEHRAEAAAHWLTIRQQREALAAALRALGFVVPPSQTNFLLAKVPEPIAAPVLQQALARAGILVRYFDAPRLRESLRITVGTPEQNRRLLEALAQALSALPSSG